MNIISASHIFLRMNATKTIFGNITGREAAHRVRTVMFNCMGIDCTLVPIGNNDTVFTYQVGTDSKLLKSKAVEATTFFNGMKMAFNSIGFSL